MESSICLWIRNELVLEFVIFAIVYFIGRFSEIIMINKIVSSVVWRINVDELDFAGVVFAQEFQCVEVVSLDVQFLVVSQFLLRSLTGRRVLVMGSRASRFASRLPGQVNE